MCVCVCVWGFAESRAISAENRGVRIVYEYGLGHSIIDRIILLFGYAA